MLLPFRERDERDEALLGCIYRGGQGDAGSSPEGSVWSSFAKAEAVTCLIYNSNYHEYT